MQHIIPLFRTARQLYSSLNIDIHPAHLADDCCIYDLADLICKEAIVSPIHRTGFYSFLFVKNALGRYQVNQYAITLRPGSICLGNPGDIIHFNFKEVKELYLLTLNDTFIKENMHISIMQEFPFLQADAALPIILNKEDFADLEQVYQQVKTMQGTHSPLHKKKIGCLLLLILLKIKEKLFYKPDVSQGRQTDILRSFKQMLQQHYLDLYNGQINRPYTACEYAAALGLHPNYLNHVVRKQTGKPVSKWIIDKTIVESKFLLDHSCLSIKEIAYRMGFAEASYFSRYFKKYARMTAVEYRRKSGFNNSDADQISTHIKAQTLTI